MHQQQIEARRKRHRHARDERDAETGIGERVPGDAINAWPLWPSVARVIIASVITPTPPIAQTCTPTA